MLHQLWVYQIKIYVHKLHSKNLKTNTKRKKIDRYLITNPRKTCTTILRTTVRCTILLATVLHTVYTSSRSSVVVDQPRPAGVQLGLNEYCLSTEGRLNQSLVRDMVPLVSTITVIAASRSSAQWRSRIKSPHERLYGLSYIPIENAASRFVFHATYATLILFNYSHF